MSILTIARISVGAVGVAPGDVALTSTDSLATITEAGYLNNNGAVQLSESDIVRALYDYSDGSGTFGIFTVSISSGVITLTAWEATGKELSDPDQPYVVTSPGSLTVGNILQVGDANGTLADGPVAANKVLTSLIDTPDVGANVLAFSTNCTAAALATAGHVSIKVSAAAKQYRIASLSLSPGTNFDAGGDRLLAVTDGTSVYTQIPAATMKSQTNSIWSATAVPAPTGGATYSTPTVAAATLYAAYTGGTTDYASGNLTLTGLLVRVA